ncbi:MAG: alpha/beta hydrolase-fold protein, partial [Halobacteriovoraceae bacterium]|nr:alpha/beta hydrolase-fold protein [Halobacteriovoraceae bacterium]
KPLSSVAATLVTLIVNTPFNTPLQDKVFVTGDFMDCQWKADCLPLKKVSDNQYKISLKLPEGAEFKITRGSWEKEASSSFGSILPNSTFQNQRVNNDGKYFVDIQNWKDLGSLKVTGKVYHLKKFYSPELDSYRDIQIRFPDNYDFNTKSFPVIYMHDGQNVFNPRTSSFGTDWAVDDVLSQMVRDGKVRDAIVVGIHHGNRFSEFNDEDRGQEYGKFLVETLKPWIDENLRTLPEKENTFLMGSSLGAAISVSLSFRYPDVFSKAAGLAFNASFFNDALFRLTSKLPMTSTSLYLDHGSRGGDQKFGPHMKRFMEHLTGLGMPQAQVDYRYFPDTSHTEGDWARRVHIPLEFLLN